MTLRTAIEFSPTTIKHESEEEGVLQFRFCSKEGMFFLRNSAGGIPLLHFEFVVFLRILCN